MDRLRSLFIALVVLGLSAGAVVAGKSISDAANASNGGLAEAGVASGLTLAAGGAPARVTPATPEPSESPDASTAASLVRVDATTGTDATIGTDATTGTKPTDNHGAIVSAAAHLSFDQLKTACAGFDGKNKGAYISAIARGRLVVTLPADSSSGTTVDSTTGTSIGSIGCTVAPASTQTLTAPTAGQVVPTASPSATAGTAPTKLHGKANAAARQGAHQPQRPD